MPQRGEPAHGSGSPTCLWLCDEMNHHAGFKTAYHKLFGVTPVMEAALAPEESDFGQFDSIMKEPFKLLVALISAGFCLIMIRL
jgi:hypothetical protein